MQEAVLRVRLYKDIDLHNELLNKINSLPRSYKAEYLRNCLLLGDSILAGQSPIPFSKTTQVIQPLVQTTVAPLSTDAPRRHETAAPEPAQEVDQTPAISSLDHREDEAPNTNTSTESDEGDDMDDISPLDPLAKMKNKFKEKGD